MTAMEADASAPVSGRASYYDGVSAARHQVTVELTPTGLRVHGTDGKLFAEWPFDALESLSAPGVTVRAQVLPGSARPYGSHQMPQCPRHQRRC